MKKELKNLLSFKPLYLLLIDLAFILVEYIKDARLRVIGDVNDRINTLFLIDSIHRYPIFYFALLLVISVLFCGVYYDYDMVEVLDAIHYKRAEYNQLIALMLFHTGVFLFLAGVCLSIAKFYVRGTDSLIFLLLKDIAVEYWLCGFCAILLGKLISLIRYKSLKYAMLIVIIFLLTPSVQAKISTKMDLSFLEILAADYNSFKCSYILCPLQLQRLGYIMFWIAAGLGILLTIFKAKVYQRAICFFLCICMLLVAFIPRTQMTTQNYYYASEVDDFYTFEADKHVFWDKKVSYFAEQYCMNLQINNQLYASVTVVFDHTLDEEELLFTLYHRYHVDKIIDQSGKELKFRQKDDYIVVYPDEDVTTLTFAYAGDGSPYYSEYTGTNLPPGFVFFPIAGFHKLFSAEAGDLKTFIFKKDVLFDITVNSALQAKFYSNLLQKEKNHFVGNSKEVFLLSGYVYEYQRDMTTFLFSSFDNVALCKDEIDRFMKKTKDKNPERYREFEGKTFTYGVGYPDQFQDMYLVGRYCEEGFTFLFDNVYKDFLETGMEVIE